MTPKAEERASRGLRAILDELPTGADIEESERFRDVLNCLEFLVPQWLAELYPEWERESLDGILPEVARKTGDGEAEISGICVLISDQATTPIHLHLQIADRTNEISWLECRLGEIGPHGMSRVKWGTKQMTAQRLRLQNLTPDNIDWAYKITYGQHCS